jgi:TonB-linked SusC/RagA family outer membrane protein
MRSTSKIVTTFSSKFFFRIKSSILIVFYILLFFLAPSSIYAQKLIPGTVSDDNGETMGNVSILLKGTKTGITTDTSGKFRITVPQNGGTLIFSHLGYQLKEVAVSSQTMSLNVRMKTDYAQLEDVVVIGYGTQKKSDVTGSLGGVTSEKLNKNRTTDVLSALQGKVAGVQISSQSGELGAGFNIKIRGANSINGSSSPLFVIDGIPLDVNSSEVAGSSLASSSTPNPLANINPQDIESIEVLKDASATAIYGSRGANGVVLISTKSGKIGKSSIEYDGNLRFNSLSKKIDVLNAQEYYNYRIAKVGAADVLASQMDTTHDGIIDIPGHDWQDEIFKNSVSQSHSLTISSGNKTTQFSGGLNYLDDRGIIITNANKRYGARLRVDHNASDKLKVGINLNVSDNIIDGATNSGGAFKGTTRRILFSRPMELYNASDASDGYDTYISPIVDIQNSYLNSNTTRLLGNGNATYKITKDLSFNLIAGGGTTDSKGKEFYSSQTTGGVFTNGSASVQNIHTYNWTNTNQLTYNRQFKNQSSLNLIGVFELSSYGFESNGMSATNFADQSTGVDDISKASTILAINTYRYVNNRVSYLSRANFNLFDKYLFTASIRADGSDKFGSKNKYGYFPSGAIAWKVSSENFMKHVTAVSNLKLRLSYGVTGNEKINPYSYLSLLDNSSYASNGTALLGLSASNPGNSDLKWEENRSANIGLDLALFQGRIEITSDYYVKQIKNMLIKAQLPTQGGYYSQFKNLGRVDNKGLEFSITSHNIRKKDITWDVDFNITYNESIIKSLGFAERQPVTISGDISNLGMMIVGEDFGTGYGYVGDGIYQLNDFTQVGTTYTLNAGVPSFSGAAVQPGSYKFKDISGADGKPDGIIDSYDQQVISHSQPKFTGGFNSTFRYKQFDFTFFLQGVAGRQIINSIKLDMTGYKGNRNLGSDFFYNRWSPTNPSNVYGTWSDQNATALQNSTFYVEDGSFLRLKSLTLAYTLPSKMLPKGMTRIRLYATGNNLITWTKYSGYDPEVSNKSELLTGVDALAYPHSLTFMIGVTTTF